MVVVICNEILMIVGSDYGTYPEILLVLIPPQYMERDGRNLS